MLVFGVLQEHQEEEEEEDDISPLLAFQLQEIV